MELCIAKAISNPPVSDPGLCISKHFQWKPHSPLSLKQTSIFLSTLGVGYCKTSSLRSNMSEETSSVKDETDFQSNEVPGEDSLIDNRMHLFQFLDKLNKIDYEEADYFLVFGSGGVGLYWIAAYVVNAIDSIPVFPKVLELVGFAYTLWFTTRYPVFKKNREEFVSKVEEIRQRKIGSQDN